MHEMGTVSTYQTLQTQIITDILTLEIISRTPIITNATTEVTLDGTIHKSESQIRRENKALEKRIAKEAKAVIPLFIPDEQAGPKTMGVMASVSSLLLTSAALSENGDAWENLKKDLQAESEAMAANRSLASLL
jgi:hypothetical protein